MTDPSIALITDSTCDIPEELVREYGIRIIPQLLIWGGETLHDRIDISPEEFYRRLGADPHLPTTTQPSPGDFQQLYRESITAEAKEIVVFTVSRAMSGTYQTACQSAEGMDIPVHVVDAKGPTMSLGWQVLAAARARALGADVAAMLAAADQVRRSLVQIVCLDTLEFLHRGGRIGSATRFLGSLLDLKPLVQINHETGLVEPSGRARTHKKAMEVLFERFFSQLKPGKSLRVAVLHGNAPEDAQSLAARIRQAYNPLELLINITGPVLGINTGPGALALCGYAEN